MNAFESASNPHESEDDASGADAEQEPASFETTGTPEFDPERIDPTRLRGAINEALEDAPEQEGLLRTYHRDGDRE